MTGNRREKKLTRQRMLETGQNYTAALRDIRAEYEKRQLEEARETLEDRD